MTFTTDKGNRDRIPETRGCPFCEPHKGCNRSDRKKHGVKKPRSRIPRGK